MDFQDRFISTFNYLSQLCRDGKGFDIGGDGDSDEEGAMIDLEDSEDGRDGEAETRPDAQYGVNEHIMNNAGPETEDQATAEATDEAIVGARDETVAETGARATAEAEGGAAVETGDDIAAEIENKATADAGEEAGIAFGGDANAGLDVVADEHRNAGRVQTNDEMDTNVVSKISGDYSANAELSMAEDTVHSAQPVSHEQIEAVESPEPEMAEDTTTAAAVTTASEVRANGADNVAPAPAEIRAEVEPDFFTTEDEGAAAPTPKPVVPEISLSSNGDDDIELLEYEDIPDDGESGTEKVADSSSKHDIDDDAGDGPETKRSKHGD